MAQKRKLDPGTIVAPAASQTNEPPPSPMGGMWGGSAMNLMRQRVDDTHGSLVEGILNGTVALSLSMTQLKDSIGSDRLTNWEGDEELERLLKNIERKGQKQPIRVRPVDPDWKPSPDDPLQTDAVFVVQSGRRRIEACRRLGREVLALVATDEGNAALADLEERYHENTMRQDLNPFEDLLSIGHIAERLKDHAQDEVADRLGVSQNDVSLGLACVEFRDEILQQVDITTTPKRAYRAIIPRLRSGKELLVDREKAPTAPRQGSFTSGTLRIDVKEGRKGLAVEISGKEMEGADLDKIAERIAALFSS